MSDQVINHNPDCAVNDKNPDGIVKPCNCPEGIAELCNRCLGGTATLDERREFWRRVEMGRYGQRNVLHLVVAGVRQLNDPRLLELVTNEALSMERAVKS